MNRNSQQIMASVLLIYWGRKVLSARACTAYAFVCAAIALGLLVSVENVLVNLMNVGLSGVVEFLYMATLNTTPMVQVSMGIAIVMAALFVRDVARTRSLV